MSTANKLVASSVQDKSNEADVPAQLKAALRSNSIKIMDLFAEWDEDGDPKGLED